MKSNDEKKLNKIHIEYTRLIHDYLMSKSTPPNCYTCPDINRTYPKRVPEIRMNVKKQHQPPSGKNI